LSKATARQHKVREVLSMQNALEIEIAWKSVEWVMGILRGEGINIAYPGKVHSMHVRYHTPHGDFRRPV
jgi:hypothetical protein